MTKDTKVTVRVDAQMYEQVVEAARLDGRSVGDWMRRVVGAQLRGDQAVRALGEGYSRKALAGETQQPAGARLDEAHGSTREGSTRRQVEQLPRKALDRRQVSPIPKRRSLT